MDSTLKVASNVDPNWGSKSNSVGTLETFPGEEVFLRQSKRFIPFDYVSRCVDVHGFCPLVTRFVKTGCVKSDGTCRNIYPMNITYENALRRFFGDRKGVVEPFTLVEGNDLPTCCSLYYDIKACDKAIFPYIVKYGTERGLLDLLLPRVNVPRVSNPTYFGHPKNQFPSGVYHTTVVTRVFTAAVMLSLGVTHGHIQGDGFCTDLHLSNPLIRSSEDFNGFVRDGEVRYVRTHRLYEAKYLRGNGPQGLNRFIITRAAYYILDHKFEDGRVICCDAEVRGFGYHSCRSCRCLCSGDYHLSTMDPYSVLKAASEVYRNLGRIVSLAAQTVGIKFDTRTNSWDSSPTVELEVSKGLVRRGKAVFPRIPYKY
jgi:hypothetical protein